MIVLACLGVLFTIEMMMISISFIKNLRYLIQRHVNTNLYQQKDPTGISIDNGDIKDFSPIFKYPSIDEFSLDS